MARFYSVQSEADAARLAAGGKPWPTGLQRANLGNGFYAWASLLATEEYRGLLQRHGAGALRIVLYEIAEESLSVLKTLDLRTMGDDEVSAWMARYSHYGNAEAHDLEYVLRNTDLGTEHYFAAAVFDKLREVP